MPPTTLTRLLPLLAIICAPTVSAAAEAAPVPPESIEAAKGHYNSGAAYYQDGKYIEAHVEFLAAYRLSRLPDLLYNLGRVSEKMGQPAEAADYYERYLKERADAPDREALQADIERLRREAAPRPAPPPAAAAPSPPKPAPPPPPRRALPPWPALGLLGGGAALLVVGVALGGAAHGAAGQVEAAERFDAALDAQGRSLQSAGIFFDVLGGLALAGGAAWTIVWWTRRGKEPAPPSTALRLARAGAGLSLTGSF